MVPRPRLVSVDTPFTEDWTHVFEKKWNVISTQNTKKTAIMKENRSFEHFTAVLDNAN